MTDYKIFRDMMVENASDYVPSTKASSMFFAMMQNRLYRHITGMSAVEIKNAREICHWQDRENGKTSPTKKDRDVAKNYLEVSELRKLERLVGRLCLRAEDIAEDGLSLTLASWEGLVEAELAVEAPWRLAIA
ncbi:RhuM family protein [Nonomuraea sp. NPDC059023]|uniref:RhuM family protein n=1 Tax=unclassified Nonomuraea TaxID=2593643 RepID=UPI0036BE0A97